MIKISSVTAPFTYTTSAHYVIVAGLYTNDSGVLTAVVVDPHYKSSPDYGTGKTYAIIEVPASTLYSLSTVISSTLIRNSFD